jgi:hypothetical protein
VVTRAFFAQRDFSQTGILKEFYDSLEEGLIGKDNETFIAMGELKKALSWSLADWARDELERAYT